MKRQNIQIPKNKISEYEMVLKIGVTNMKGCELGKEMVRCCPGTPLYAPLDVIFMLNKLYHLGFRNNYSKKDK